MYLPIFTRVKQAWNAFFVPTTPQGTPLVQSYQNIGPSSSSRPDRPTVRFYNDKSLISSIYTRMSIDVSGVNIRHVVLDDVGRYSEDTESSLNQCLTFEPNIDQSPRSFRQDIAMTLFDKGSAAIVPVDTGVNPADNAQFEIYSLRVGEIIAWYPKHIRVSVYNERTGLREEITLEKRFVSIIENPLYSVMNAPNSTLQRLIRKLYLLDAIDEQSSSGKLDLIIQLPYVIKSEARRKEAEKRRQDIEFQLKGSQYGIAYTDGTEKITQLNRPAENNLLAQVELLINMLYGQLGITAEVMNGTADEKTMLNYYNRTIEPILDAMVESMQRAFLGVMGIQKQERIRYFRDPFKFVTATDMAEIADKFTRNEIFTSNEIRQFMGISPSKDPKADQLINSNMPQPGSTAPAAPAVPAGPNFDEVDAMMNQVFDGLSSDVEKLTRGA
jgi:putative sterol carrier protein